MSDRLDRSEPGPTLLLFGSQALNLDQDAFLQIRSTVLESPDHRWILDTIAEFPEYFESISNAFPKFSTGSRRQLLEDFNIWFKTGNISKIPFTFPNTVLTPLVVIAQLTEYAKYVETYQQPGNNHNAQSVPATETLGLCTGLLSAMAVSCSKDKEELRKYGAVALRLGMLIGMVVDTQDETTAMGEAKSFAIVWNSVEAGEDAIRIIKSFPETYISVSYDDNRATVTTPASTALAMQKQLKASKIISAEVGISGRFHWEQYRDQIDALVSFCDSDARFQFVDATELVIPTRSNSGGTFITGGPLHHEALRSILVEPPQWFETFHSVQDSMLKDKNSLVISFGPERCVPPSIIRRLSSQVVYMADIDHTNSKVEKPLKYQRQYSETDIAVVGMSCKVAGADDVEEFWDLLCKGKSQHQEVPKERFGFETAFREVDPKRKWFGNFMNDHDKFDHKFFKKSPREIASTDPQQRQLLQIAYQAVEQSGYFRSPNADNRIGCYVGVCATDYENNIACHAPNAFSATGNLRGFIAGKVSHFFGWTGPGLTIDTACSSSAVAVHQACQAILSGECNAALASGTHVMTNPLWFQNLAGASFLSTTGACKPFDAKADGYCRGEGVAAVFLKKMSAAIRDGDQILGTIAGTAVQQNQNCTPIFVPNAPSLSDLFRVVTQRSGLKPEQITVVEAHGTGTAVGDPAEYESIREVLGGRNRSSNLMLSSVKGLVGHVECTSGLVSLIKTLLMIQKAAIPPQASFDTMNPAIKATVEDHMKIPTSLQPWDASFRAALINNYGASGSNASIVVSQAPETSSDIDHEQVRLGSLGKKYPFWFAALDDKSLRSYSVVMRQFLERTSKDLSLSNISFNLSRQSNRTLGRGLMFSCGSIDELTQKLASYERGDPTLSSVALPSPRPVVLCFGGQVSTFVGLDRQLYDTVKVLRTHLDRCNSLCLSLGVGSIFPEIFSRTPIADPVKLQTALFSLQWSCAQSWMDSGVKPVAVLGHSFGELTALCVSGILTPKDTLKMIISRATVIREKWGSDKGAMMAVEADLSDVEKLMAKANQQCPEDLPVSIACYNGPRSFTLAGSSKAINAIAEIVVKDLAFPSIRSKQLKVSNAFHSALVDPLIDSLEQGVAGLQLHEPTIPMERATEFGHEVRFTAKFVAEHMRQPVYFHHALQRLTKKYPSCIWLEAGSQSTVTNMASRALGSPSDSHFQAVNITSERSLDNLVDTTLNLWKAGLDVSFWSHHTSQTYEHRPLLLPPYQFEKAHHWMELKQASQKPAEPVEKAVTKAEVLPDTLLTFVGYQDGKNHRARFRINTMIPKYDQLIVGHVIAQTAPICPATVQIDLAIEGLRSLHPEMAVSKREPQVHGVENQSPICVDPARSVWIDFEGLDSESYSWNFKVFSTGSQKGATTTTHTTGKIVFRSTEDLQTRLEFARLERMVGHQRCLDILNSNEADDVIQGRNIYKTFAEIVDYGEEYRGLKKLVGQGNESAGRVVKKYNNETWLDAHLADAFCQVGGIWVNCMTERSPTDMYIANGIEQWIRSPKLSQADARPETWNVLAYHHAPSDKSFLTDIFVFHPATGELLEAIHGISYVKVPKASMSKLLSRLTAGEATSSHSVAAISTSARLEVPDVITQHPLSKQTLRSEKTLKPKKQKSASPKPDVSQQVKAILAELSGLELDEIKDDSELANVGIDSLMGMEMAREIELQLKCTLPTEQLVEVTDIPGLMRCVHSALGFNNFEAQSETDDDESESSDNPSVFTSPETGSSTPPSVEVDIQGHLVEFLGLDPSDIQPEMLLRDLGVDSLLSTELRADLATIFDVEIDEHVAIEELTVAELEGKVNGRSKPAPKTVATGNAVSGGHSLLADATAPTSTSISSPSGPGGLNLPASVVLEAFGETKLRTDHVIDEYRCGDYVDSVKPKQDKMCVALTVEAFEQMGSSIRSAKAGQVLTRITHIPEHGHLVDYLYQMLEKEARLITIDGNVITRTGTAAPDQSSKEILQDLLKSYPDHTTSNDLTYYAGSNLAQVLTGKTDGIKLIFASEEGRRLVSGLYGDWPVNRLFYKQMEDFLSRLLSKLPKDDGPLKILEMGAGTGGTTKWLVPLLASLNVDVEYTFTDLGPSFVAAARKKFKKYPFMKFRTHDIEKAPADDLLNTQHIIVASNAVHATHSLAGSAANIRKALRPDGLLMMLEMTGTLYWVDMIFGLFEGWWFFDDGRTHAVSSETRWEKDLQSVGYGHVDWTDGARAENKIEKVIIAMASGSRYDRLPAPSEPTTSFSTDCAARQAVVEDYVRKGINGFACPSPKGEITSDPLGQVVLITGATGSVGCHLVANLAMRPGVQSIVCLNRRSNQDPITRQKQSLTAKGIFIPADGLAKLQVFESDAAKPQLGLPDHVYQGISKTVTHIIHNAWLMSAKRPVKGFESQFRIMRNMINLASDISGGRQEGFKVNFQFVSSIACVGHYPLWKETKYVPEERMAIDAVLPNGYGDAKYVCELMLDETLHKHPDRFRVMAVRIGQIAGSKASGYWNPMEHLAFLWKSSQTLKALPNFDGLLSWTPVDDVAGTLVDLVNADNPYPIYHIDNPVRQEWKDMIPIIAEALEIPITNAMPFEEWVEQVRNFPMLNEDDNPAMKLIDFLDGNFTRMSCGGLLLETSKSREHSATLRAVTPVSQEVAKRFFQTWKDMRFLS
ncbi:polyketide synthase [Hyphodiscus hymeniophilus]|uniref:Polyketide synthase n=1 Tax=Hyphodiscus hymeniophilus TaxID=353542 RepID=A0A9P6SQM6_9HELO|nr:polyketide synthase [Hyphodiscus hymeniophilus]